MKKLSILFSLVLVFLSCEKKVEEKISPKPNILFIFADDQRADALGIAGNPNLKTPNIDALAKRGTRFTNAYVMGGNHGAICAASRAMLMSGKGLFRVLDKLEGEHTMPMHFAAHGYTTFGTGKWHNERSAFEQSFQHGTNVFLGGMANHYSISLRDMTEADTLSAPENKGYSTDLFTSSAIDFIEKHVNSGAENPFFAYVSFTVPHDPYSPREDFIDRYSPDEIKLPENFLPLHPFQFDQLNIRDENLLAWPRDPEKVKAVLADYYALITHLDTQVGTLIETLKRLGQYDNTIIVYAADNGLAIGSHGLLGKQNMYEHSSKVPMIIAGPGVPENEIQEAYTYLFDLFPTLAALADLPLPEGIDGVNLVKVMDGNSEGIRGSMFNAYRHTVRSIRKDDWKLIRYPERDFTQLFNLKDDPDELNNLADKPEMAPKIEELRALLLQEQQAAGDTVAWTAEEILPLEYDYKRIDRFPDRWQPEYTLDKYFSDLED
ncbi:sulfatase-like hydrolase/transferase [Algoriphagus namhaensis]|uniref:Sulfatase-like hydrolase/transferase n=1 Tax=Algoriphagus namhaensis TaxID=915353 RepID=A0ABV8AM05_9BACT